MRFIYSSPSKIDADHILIENASVLTSDYEKIYKYGPIVAFFMLVMVVIIWMASGVDPLWLVFSLPSHPVSVLSILGVAVGVTLMHEILHLIAYPKFWKNENAGFGFVPIIMMPYAWYAGILTKKHAMFALMAPFLVITCLPLLFQIIFRSFEEDSYIPFASAFNAMSAGGDLLLSWVILRYVPKNAYMQGTAYGMKLKSGNFKNN